MKQNYAEAKKKNKPKKQPVPKHEELEKGKK